MNAKDTGIKAFILLPQVSTENMQIAVSIYIYIYYKAVVIYGCVITKRQRSDASVTLSKRYLELLEKNQKSVTSWVLVYTQ
jgi:hypothetical protein